MKSLSTFETVFHSPVTTYNFDSETKQRETNSNMNSLFNSGETPSPPSSLSPLPPSPSPSHFLLFFPFFSLSFSTIL